MSEDYTQVEHDGMNDQIADLMIRYEMGDFEPRIRERIALIYRMNPPDAMQRLQRAADYLQIRQFTGLTEGRLQKLLEKRLGIQEFDVQTPLIAPEAA